jgi:mono/diheme cytochrome c family protein
MLKLSTKTIALTALTLAAAGSLLLAQEQRRRERVKAPEAPKASVTADDPVQAGKYLIMIGGCNDCHTAGYVAKRGKVPESEWLKGDVVGYQGPWGTTYASNLRLTVDMCIEHDFVGLMRKRDARPPMPWLSLHAMSDQDLRAIYQYIKQLPGEKGPKAPDYAPPGAQVKGPVVVFPEPPAE